MCAKKIGLEQFLMLSYSAEKSLKSGSDSILADALESVLAAVYLDSGLDSAASFVINSLIPIMMSKNVMTDTNYKSILLESVQAEGKGAPVYDVMEESGPDHEKEFTVGVYVDNELLAIGIGKSKKQAEQIAARKAMDDYLENKKF
jgi:ribonuclease-3